jgi:hypothetical protein
MMPLGCRVFKQNCQLMSTLGMVFRAQDWTKDASQVHPFHRQPFALLRRVFVILTTNQCSTRFETLDGQNCRRISALHVKVCWGSWESKFDATEHWQPKLLVSIRSPHPLVNPFRKLVVRNLICILSFWLHIIVWIHFILTLCNLLNLLMSLYPTLNITGYTSRACVVSLRCKDRFPLTAQPTLLRCWSCDFEIASNRSLQHHWFHRQFRSAKGYPLILSSSSKLPTNCQDCHFFVSSNLISLQYSFIHSTIRLAERCP